LHHHGASPLDNIDLVKIVVTSDFDDHFIAIISNEFDLCAYCFWAAFKEKISSGLPLGKSMRGSGQRRLPARTLRTHGSKGLVGDSFVMASSDR
jgi:hypothetical protein